jgi:hypothetical protein
MPRRKGPGGRRKGAGRPPLAVSRDITKRLRMTAQEEAAQEAAAARQGLTWSEWIREAAELAIARGSTR